MSSLLTTCLHSPFTHFSGSCLQTALWALEQEQWERHPVWWCHCFSSWISRLKNTARAYPWEVPYVKSYRYQGYTLLHNRLTFRAAWLLAMTYFVWVEQSLPWAVFISAPEDQLRQLLLQGLVGKTLGESAAKKFAVASLQQHCAS